MEKTGGEGDEPGGMEGKRMDLNVGQRREERAFQEEESPIVEMELEKMQRVGEAQFPNINAASPACGAAPATAALKDSNDERESSQMSSSRILHLTCKFDSTSSLSSIFEGMPIDTLDDSGRTALHHAAEQHSVRCIEYLLKRRAKTDIKSNDGLIALEVALTSERLQTVNWSAADRVTELHTLIGDKDLTAIRILAAHTRDLSEIASRMIVHGNIVQLAVLLRVSGDTLVSTNVTNTEEHDGGTLFDIILKKTISIGDHGSQAGDTSSDRCPSNAQYNIRQILLKELELFLRWYSDHDQTASDSRRSTPPTTSAPSPLIRAAQAGDVDVVSLLIENGADISETDAGGNSALHWSLRATVSSRDIRLILKLLRHGASLTTGNRLGLTPVHIAAGQGHLQALQILVAMEPSSVHAVAETKETPLFFAVKGNHYDCVRLLLQYGASRQVLNLRKERPIDVASTSDIRALLSLQELSARTKDMKSVRSPSVPAFGTENHCPNHAYDTDTMRFQTTNEQFELLEYSDESLRQLIQGKPEMCRYFSMPGGCARGDKCFYAHREEDLQGRQTLSPVEVKHGITSFSAVVGPAKMVKRVSEDLSKKIFVGGLSPSVESDDLREFFEGKFGAVMDAVVIGSHAGDHVQSRGFGFVTFKHEESVISAVRAHYVNIFGKKVEIKGAVPRSVLPTLESAKGETEQSRPGSAESSKFSEANICKGLESSSLDLLCPAKADLQLQMMNLIGYHGESANSAFQNSFNEESLTADVGASTSSRPQCSLSQGTPWILKFKQWLPKFLAEVSNRLKEGEWYPLSSLKGDFRATCGLELDHVAIGFHKLSDFVRSIPDSCRMKIVPVGRGPATHMVLLPALMRLSPSITNPPQALKSTISSSLVDAGRSYAAACQLPSKVTVDSNAQSRNSLPQASLSGSLVGQLDARNVFSSAPLNSSIPSRYEELRPPESFLSQCRTPAGLHDGGVGHGIGASIAQDQHGKGGNLMQEANLGSLRNLITHIGTDNGNGQGAPHRVTMQGTEYSTTQNFQSAGQYLMDQARGGVTRGVSPESIRETYQEDPKTPIHQVSLRPYSAFNHPFTGFLPQDCVTSTVYSMWGKQVGQMQKSQTIANLKQQPISAKSSDQGLSWDDSPQSVLLPHGYNYSQSGIQEATRSLFSPGGQSPLSPRDQSWGSSTCVCCGKRPCLWVAIPCNHYALCADCKDVLQKMNRSTANCPVCTSHVQRWIAFH